MALLHPELHSIHPHGALPFSFAQGAALEPTRARQPVEARYVLVQHAPLQPGEFERAEATVLEVIGRWGSTVLFATHLSSARNFVIGESTDVSPVDFELQASELGAGRCDLIEVRNGVAHVTVPASARARVKHASDSRFSETDARSIALLTDTAVEVELGPLTFCVANVVAGVLTPRAGLKSAEGSVLAAFGASFGVAAALLAAVAFWMPALGADDDAELDRDRLVMMQQYLSAQAERSREETANNAESGQKDSQPGAPAAAAAGRAGVMGKPNLANMNRRAAATGDAPNPQLAHAAAVEAARSFGMIELLGTLSSAGSSGSPFLRDPTLGGDTMDADGNLWGDTIGDSGGSGGLHLLGADNGGGGHGDSIGVGTIGTCGSANCGASGWGHSNSLGHGEHHTKGPRLGMVGSTIVTGRIPPEVVQRIVRQNYGRFRMCYENGLRANPNLGGRVMTRFVIGRDGSVANASNGGSDLADAGVVSCVVSAFYGLSFPTPENGIVTVSYPITFSPE